MTVAIGFSIGQTCTVDITEEHDGAKQTTRIDPVKFLEDSGLGIYFYQLKPDFARAFRNELRRAARKPKLRPNKQPSKVRTMPARKRRTDRELKPAAVTP